MIWSKVARMNLCEKIGINEAIKRFGGFVRYYDTTESLQQLAKLISVGDCQNILASKLFR